MAYQPSRSPFAPAQQDSFYSNSRNGLRGYGLSNQPIPLSNKVNGYFEKDRTLPLYKDKPFFQPRRTGPRRRWRPFFYILVGCSLVFLMYYNFYLSAWSGLQSNDKGVELWKWAQTLEDGKVSESSDWTERREKVRDAFIVSWEGYEQNAWGRLHKNYGELALLTFSQDMISIALYQMSTRSQRAGDWAG